MLSQRYGYHRLEGEKNYFCPLLHASLMTIWHDMAYVEMYVNQDLQICSTAPLRSDAKVPLRSGLCDINDTNMQSMLSRKGTIAFKKKTQKRVTRHSRDRDHTSYLRLNADAREKTSAIRRRVTFRVGYIYNIRRYDGVLVQHHKRKNNLRLRE